MNQLTHCVVFTVKGQRFWATKTRKRECPTGVSYPEKRCAMNIHDANRVYRDCINSSFQDVKLCELK